MYHKNHALTKIPMINWTPQPTLPSAIELHVDTLLIEIEEMLSQNRVIHQMKKIGNNYKLLTFHKFPTIRTTHFSHDDISFLQAHVIIYQSKSVSISNEDSET